MCHEAANRNRINHLFVVDTKAVYTYTIYSVQRWDKWTGFDSNIIGATWLCLGIYMSVLRMAPVRDTRKVGIWQIWCVRQIGLQFRSFVVYMLCAENHVGFCKHAHTKYIKLLLGFFLKLLKSNSWWNGISWLYYVFEFIAFVFFFVHKC